MKSANFIEKKCLLALVCGLCLAMAAPVMGEELAREPFQRLVGVQVESLGGPGDLNPWDSNHDPNWLIGAGSLQYIDVAGKSPPTLGNKLIWQDNVAGTNHYARHNIADWNYDVGVGGTQSLYRSFLIKCTALPEGESYVANFRFRDGHDGTCRLWTRPDGAGGIELGTASSSDAAAATWSTPPITIALNAVTMIVTRLDMVPGDDNDLAYLWVNPLLDTAEPPADIAAVYGGGNEPLQPGLNDNHTGRIQHLVFRRDNDPVAGVYEWDDDRFGTTWEDVTHSGPVYTEDLTPPTISDREPDPNIEVIGPLTVVSFLYNEPLDPASAPVAGDVTVNDSPATTMVNMQDSTAGHYLFSGFTPVQPGTTATISLKAGVGTDAAGNAFEGDTYQCLVVADPGDVAYLTEHFHYPDGITLNPVQEWAAADNNLLEHEIRNGDTAGDGGSASLQYPGLTNLSQSGRFLNKGTGADEQYRLAPYPLVIRGEGKAAYTSFLIKMTTAPDGVTAWWRHRNQGSPNATHGRLVFNSNLEMGVRMEDTASDVFVLPAKALVLGQTALVVTRYTMVPGISNDTMEVWVNPPLGGVPPPPDAITTADLGTEEYRDVNPAGGIRGFENRISNATSGVYEMDEMRFGPSWASVTADIALDTAGPVVDTEFPVRDTSVLGAITHVEVNFDEFVTGVTPAMLTVDGSAATTVTRNLPFRMATAEGSYVFSGFAPAATPGAVNVALTGPTIKDASGNAFAGDSWSVTLAAPPEDGLLVYEPFDYPNDSALAGNGSWTDEAFTRAPAENLKILAGNPSTANLFYGTLPISEGGRVIGTQRSAPFNQTVYARLPLAMPVVGEGSSLYVSFIYQGRGEVGVDAYYAFFQSENSDTPEVGRFESSELNDPFHTLSTRWTTDNYSPTATESGAGHAIGKPVFVVAKVTINPGPDNDSITMWVNPMLGLQTERLGGLTSTVQAATFEDLNVAHGFKEFVLRTNTTIGEFDVDELRIGTTWAAVTPSTSVVIPPTSANTWLLYEN